MSFYVRLEKRTYLVIVLSNGDRFRLGPAAPCSRELSDDFLLDPGITNKVQTGLIKIIRKDEETEETMKTTDAVTSVETGARKVTGADGHPTMIRKPVTNEDKKGEDDDQ